MRVGITTIVGGRRDQLARQAAAITALAHVSAYVVVAMDEEPVTVAASQILRVAAGARGLPLATARNRGLRALSDCELAIALDVDCIPDPAMVGRYVAAARELRPAPALLCGPVGYLSTPVTTGVSAAERRDARRRVIRDFPVEGMRREPRPELFWSLSFALAPATHRRVGGFDEAYCGYGAEDTDYGLRAAAAGVPLWFVGGAWAYHQPHPASAPLRVAEVAANAARFHARWGWWPMPDVLQRLADAGRLRWSPAGAVCEVVEPAPAPEAWQSPRP